MNETTAPPRPAAAELDDQAVIVRIGEAEFGIPIRSVREVLHVLPITRLPFATAAVPGVVSVRGSVLPVVDLGERLFAVPARRDGRLVVVHEPASGEVALLVDAVADLVRTSALDAEPPPEVAASLPPGWVAGVITPSEDRLVTLLELARVLDRNESHDEESR